MWDAQLKAARWLLTGRSHPTSREIKKSEIVDENFEILQVQHSASSMAAAQKNMQCPVCLDIYKSPRFLPCHHSFCLPCLEKLAKTHGNTIPCPSCRAPAKLPRGGVAALKVNFYFTEEDLERARRPVDKSMCSTHTEERLTFYCTKCDQAVCLRCKLTKHDGHGAVDLSEAATRCKRTIEEELRRLQISVERITDQSDTCKLRETRAKEKREAVTKEIEARYEEIVATARNHRAQALQQLQEISDSLEKDLSDDTQRVQRKLKSLLQLHENSRWGLSVACDTELLQVERELTRGQGSAERLAELEAGMSEVSHRPGLYAEFIKDLENYIKRYIGSPAKLSFPCQVDVNILEVGRCGDGGCVEVHALREMEDEVIEVFYGRPGGDYSEEKGTKFLPNGQKSSEVIPYDKRVSCVTRWKYEFVFDNSAQRIFGSKGQQLFGIYQNCTTGFCDVHILQLESEGEQVKCRRGATVFNPEVDLVHNFDSNKLGKLFAVVDEVEDLKVGPRVVRLYAPTSDAPIATYKPPKQPFLPTDVCFCDDNLLLIADWMNDCIHVTRATDVDLTFIDYLPGSGDIVRPSALNLDLLSRLMIGCGDGSVLRYLTDISPIFK